MSLESLLESTQDESSLQITSAIGLSNESSVFDRIDSEFKDKTFRFLILAKVKVKIKFQACLFH